MTKELWRKNWLESINKLTSFDYQKNNWIPFPHKNSDGSFAESLSEYRQKVLFGSDYRYYLEEQWITQREFYIIKDWHAELELYEPPDNDIFDDLAILNDREWRSILRMGMFAKQKLRSVIPVDEKEYLCEFSLSQSSYIRF